MFRRIFSVCLVLGLLLAAFAITLPQKQIKAQAASTATLSRTPSPVSTNDAHPDLTVTSLVYAGSTPACANAPVDNVTVKNIGTGAAGMFVVSLGSVTKTVTALAASQSITLSFPAVSGTLTAVADSTNLVAELNESNNTLVASLGAPTQAPTCTPTATVTSNPNAPDLTVVSIGEYGIPQSSLTKTPDANGCWWNPWIGTTFGIRVTIQNIGAGDAGAFVVSLNDQTQNVTSLAAGQTMTVDFGMSTRTRVATVDSTGLIAESNETNNSLTLALSAATATGTRTPRPTECLSRTNTPTITRTPTGPTPTRTLTATITRTPTVTLSPTLSLNCSPVSSTIAAPFTFDGAGTFCWQTATLGAYINSWNVTTLSVNGFNLTNAYVPSASYPAKINGYWYVGYDSAVAWGHFETK